MQLQQRSVTEIFSESMASEVDHKGCMEKQPKLTLFGMDLTERYSTFSLDQPVQGFGEQIPAKKLGHKMVPELENNRGPNFLLSNKEGSAFKSWSSAHGSERRNFVVSNADQGSTSRSSSSAEAPKAVSSVPAIAQESSSIMRHWEAIRRPIRRSGLQANQMPE